MTILSRATDAADGALHRFWSRRRFANLMRDWRRAAGRSHDQPDLCADRALVYPSDPATVFGSLGDTAMITAAGDLLRATNPTIGIDIVCDRPAGRVVAERGFSPVYQPEPRSFVADINKLLEERRYAQVIVIGGDVIDGRYNAIHALKTLVAADLAARKGAMASVSGFSFVSRPRPELAEILNRLDRRVRLNVRDEVSLRNLHAFADVEAHAVSDVAFTLKPGIADPMAVTWIERARSAGRTVLAFNMHPHLFPELTGAARQDLAASVAAALSAISDAHQVSWLLLPHDTRGEGADSVCLGPLFERLQATGMGERCHLIETATSPADLKALTGHLDGAFTGRMHLAIAALGMGVPVICAVYQEKFEGLFRHFDLPTVHLLQPQSLFEADALTHHLSRFVSELPGLAEKVRDHLPEVEKLAGQNFPGAA